MSEFTPKGQTMFSDGTLLLGQHPSPLNHVTASPLVWNIGVGAFGIAVNAGAESTIFTTWMSGESGFDLRLNPFLDIAIFNLVGGAGQSDLVLYGDVSPLPELGFAGNEEKRFVLTLGDQFFTYKIKSGFILFKVKNYEAVQITASMSVIARGNE